MDHGTNRLIYLFGIWNKLGEIMLLETESNCFICGQAIKTSFDNPDICPHCGAAIEWDSNEDNEGYLTYFIISCTKRE